jgi:zinc transporter ZupT
MISYILTFGAVILGYILASIYSPKNKKSVKLLLAFSGAFLLSLTVLHLLPDLYNPQTSLKSFAPGAVHVHVHDPIGIYIMIGILFQIILEYFSRGAEHGHVHTNNHNHHSHEASEHIPWLLFFSLCLHALLEGFPIHQNPSLAYGIAIHHFPIAIILTLFFKNAGLKPKYIAGFMIAFALMTPLGTFFANTVTGLQSISRELTAIVIGILFHISATIIFESNEGHKFNLAKLSAIVLGFVLAFVVENFHTH